jgi:GTPase involved in cell partitioning and DNA repair
LIEVNISECRLFIQDLGKNTKAVNDMIAAINILAAKVKELDEKLDNPNPIVVLNKEDH